MKGPHGWYSVGCALLYLSFVQSTPIHRDSQEALLLDPRALLGRQDYSSREEDVVEVPEDSDIYRIVIPKKGQSLVYDDVGLSKRGGELDAEDVLSLLQSAPARRHYDYYLPEGYLEDPNIGDEEARYLLGKEGTVKRRLEDEFSKVKDKKDLESLLYQANPALTVQKLPLEPQIDFRKFNNKPSDAKEEDVAEQEKETFQKQLRGMEEVIQPRPSLRRDRALDRMEPPIFG